MSYQFLSPGPLTKWPKCVYLRPLYVIHRIHTPNSSNKYLYMKIELIRDTLVDAVGKAEKVAGKNPTLPVIAGLFLEAKNKLLTIRATNLDLGVSINVPAKVLEEGAIVVPAHILSSFLNSLGKEKSITLESNTKTLSVTTDKTKTSMNLLSAEDFPVIPELRDDDAFKVPAKDLVSGIKSVLYAASVGSIKPELSSVCLSYDGEHLVFVATDSFRLAEKKIKSKHIPPFTQILIPQKNAAEIARIFDGAGEDVSLVVEEHQLALRSGNVYVTSRVIDGVFPDYKQVIPKESAAEATLLKQDLQSSLKTSLIFSDQFNQLKISLDPKDKKFEIESKNQNVGESVYNISAALTGKALSIAVNHRYFTDCFNSVAADSLTLSFAGEGRPIVVHGVGDKTFMYLVMPMNRS